MSISILISTSKKIVKIIIKFETISYTLIMTLSLIHIKFQKNLKCQLKNLIHNIFSLNSFKNFVKEQVSTIKNNMLWNKNRRINNKQIW